ncbi:MAG TPA: hypothetical protein VGG30_05910 [Pirellulales bacterium]|jgi:hypothetical protein
MPTDRNIETGAAKSPCVWNAGAWFGSQLGGSAWALIAAAELLLKDPVSAAVCLGSFVALNVYGLTVWRSRDTLTAYGGLQRLLAAFTVFCAVIIVVLNARGIAEPHTPSGAVPTKIPYWYIAAPPGLMLWCFLQQRAARRRSA